jgi:hypothetical protein
LPAAYVVCTRAGKAASVICRSRFLPTVNNYLDRKKQEPAGWNKPRPSYAESDTISNFNYSAMSEIVSRPDEWVGNERFIIIFRNLIKIVAKKK